MALLDSSLVLFFSLQFQGNLWSSILNKNCHQSVCIKTGNKATWKQCPKAATEEVIKQETDNLKEAIENQTKKLDEMQEVIGKIMEKIGQNCGMKYWNKILKKYLVLRW